MLKFHLRLLLLISTITIISFIGLGAIIHNTIYQTLTSNQIKSLDSEARNYVNLFNNNKEKEITNIAHNEKYHINKKKIKIKLFTQVEILKILTIELIMKLILRN